MPVRLRPREAMDKLGPKNVEDDALLAIFLRSGARGLNVVDLASGLLTRFGTLDGISDATNEELLKFPGMGPVKIRELRAALEVGRRMHQDDNTAKRPKIKTPEHVVNLLQYEVRTLDHEIFWAILLDAKNHMNSRPVDITHGILDASLVHPREVFKEAIQALSSSIILVHNHPSGNPEPSDADIDITKRILETGKAVGIDILDHIIIANNRSFSFKEKGLVL